MTKRRSFRAVAFALCMALVISLIPGIAFAESGTTTDYYQEKGQINLKNLELSLREDGTLKIKGTNCVEKERCIKELNNSKQLAAVLAEQMEDGKIPLAIGYTRVYLKEVEDEKGEKHFEPISNAEALSDTISGNKEKRGNLTLYTTAFATKQGITAESVAQWGTNFQLSQENTPAAYDDYISIKTSNKYIINSTTFNAKMTNGESLPKKFFSKKNEKEASVVYAFKEMVENAYSLKSIRLKIDCGKNGTPPATIKSVSKYVHTWGAGQVEIGFDVTGPTFTLTNVKKSWQIASSVNVPSA